MIKLKLSAFDNTNIEYEKIEGELASESLKRILSSNEIEEQHFDKFQVLINGHKIDPEFLNTITIRESDIVLIAPIISGGNFGQIFKTAVIIAVTVIVSVYAAPLGPVTAAFLTAGATIGTTLLMNSLIPPPSQGMASSGLSYGNSSESSQMYSINGQSNQAKRYGYVPRVYGTHRSFPNVAANPYTEIEADPATGQLVQYFYAIYDFGYGPAIVNDLRIGDTALSNFVGVDYRLVDINKPNVSEGVWDDLTEKTFAFYKGDYEQDGTIAVLNGNRDSGSPLGDYQVIRSASPNGDLVEQEITINFSCPRGLISYATDGSTSERNIGVEVYLAEEGTENWKSFNDPATVRSFKAVGGDARFHQESIQLYPFSYNNIFPYTVHNERTSQSSRPTGSPYSNNYEYKRYLSIPKGTTNILVAKNSLNIGEYLISNNKLLGKVLSKIAYNSSYEYVVLDTATDSNIYVGAISNGYSDYDGYFERVSENSTYGAVGRAGATGGLFIISRKTTEQALSMVKFVPRENKSYKLKVIRVYSNSSYTFSVQDNLAISSIVTRFDRNPIRTNKRHLFLELKIKATNQLNGSIQNLSGVVSSVLNTYNGTTWSKQITSNPAWIFYDLLSGEINKRALPQSRIHLPSILEWANYCDQIPSMPPGQGTAIYPRHTLNFILDFETTLQTILSSVSNAANASLNIIDGKYGVLIDKNKTIPVQIFTPRNSSGFSSIRNYVETPHAVKVKFVDPASNWEVTERVVYDDGYNSTNATKIDELSSFGITNEESAWRYGRYMMAQNRLRQETISLNVDFEHLVCTRGDYVQITQDIMKAGGFPARVKSVSGTIIEIDDSIETSISISYAYVFRSVTGEIKTASMDVVNAYTFDLNGDIPQVGDLIVVGELGKTVMDCLVKSITPNDDLSAQIVLVEKADAIYNIETSSTIPSYDPQISTTADTQYLPPSEVSDLAVVENTWRCLGTGYEYYIKLDWDVPPGSAYDVFEIYVDEGQGYDLHDYSKYTEYKYVVPDTKLGIEHKFKILAVSSTGKKLDLGVVSQVLATPLPKTTRPSNVEFLYTNITGEVLQLDWPAIPDCDCDEYLIRYSPTLTGTWETSIPLARVDRNTTLISTQARTGTYLIKALDFNENESNTATVAITTIPNLFNLNVIDEITDFPSLSGEKNQVVKDGNALMLKTITSGGPTVNQYYSEGYYYYNTFLDLGQIYTVRLQSLIQAEGYTVADLMSNWITLDQVLALANSGFSDWDVKTQYRGTDQFNTMAEWVTLSSIDPISEGVQDNWSAWRDFTISDATARIFQFRLKLISNKPSVTPRVFDGTIRADMPDRLESYNNQVVPIGGLEIIYSPAFKGPGTSPNIQVSIESGQSGDYFLFDYKSLDGFKIRIYDNSDTEVSRTVDVAIKGYGRKNTVVI